MPVHAYPPHKLHTGQYGLLLRLPPKTAWRPPGEATFRNDGRYWPSASRAASVGVECAGFSARCLRRVYGTALPQALLRARDVWGACTALESRDLAIGARAGAQWKGAPRRGVGGVRGGAWVGRAPAGSESGRHVEEGGWCCSNDEACRSAALPTAPLPSRRVAASRGQCRWCGGGGSLHRPAAGAAITSMRGGCRRLVWLAAYRYAAPPEPYCRSSAWRLGRAAVVVADGMAAAAAGSPFPPAAIPIPPRSREVARIYL